MGSPVAQFGDILLDPEGDADGLAGAGWTAVEGSGADLFFAQKVREDLHLLPPVSPDTGRRSSKASRRRSPTSPSGSAADGPGSAYSPRDRSAYRRRLKRLAEHGELTFGAFDARP